MSERLSITPLGPYIGAQVSGADLTRPLSDNQFEQLYHAVLRHQVSIPARAKYHPGATARPGAAVWRPAYSSGLPSRPWRGRDYRPRYPQR